MLTEGSRPDGVSRDTALAGVGDVSEQVMFVLHSLEDVVFDLKFVKSLGFK